MKRMKSVQERAYRFIEAEKYKEAQRVIMHALNTAPNDAHLHLLLGRVYAETECPSQALEEYTRSLQLGYDPVSCYHEMAYEYCSLKQFDEALRLFYQALEHRSDDADSDDEREDIYYGIGFALYKKEALEEALHAYQRALEICPSHLFTICGIAETRLASGIKFVLPEQFILAERIARQGIAISPNHSPLWRYLGDALYWQNRYEESEAAYLKSLAISRDALTLMHFGDLYEEMQNFESAEAMYREAIAESPTWIAPYSRLAEFLYDLERYEEAIPYYKKIVELATEQNRLPAKDWQHYGFCLSFVEEYQEALAAYQNALQICSEDADTLYYIGNAYMSLDYFQEAFNAYEKSLVITPAYIDVRFNIGLALYELGRKPEAFVYLNEVLLSENSDDNMKGIAQEKIASRGAIE